MEKKVKKLLLLCLVSCRGYYECVFHPELDNVLCHRPSTNEKWTVPHKDMKYWRCVSSIEYDNMMRAIESKFDILPTDKSGGFLGVKQ